MKKITFFFLFACFHALAQKQANTWYFGKGIGLDFNGTCTPSVLTNGQIDGFEGCVTMSDKTSGQLLFYSNSEKVWDRNHQIMPNGNLGIVNGNSITQVLAIQKPGFDSIYYLFTTQMQAQNPIGLKLQEINMSLNAGFGDLSFKDSVIYADTVTEGIAAVKHANGTDVWVIAHKDKSNEFLSFLVSSNGVSLTPVVSPIGKFRNGPFGSGGGDEIGEMKASPNGLKLGVVTYYNPHIELFDFNKSTGQISNPITLPELGGYTGPTSGGSSGVYGVSFSSTSRFLYISRVVLDTIPGRIMQYDISSNDSALINNTRINIPVNSNFFNSGIYSLKLAPNKKIYAGQNGNTSYIGVINAPDSAGLNCNYVHNAIYFNGIDTGWGLNNLMEYGEESYCTSSTATLTTGTNQMTSGFVSISLYPNPTSTSATFKFTNANNQTSRLSIYNVQGWLVLNRETSESEIRIEKSDLGSGLFFYKLKVGESNITTGKLVVQ